ncbi:MAG: hypothetical protein IAI49_02030 [Candidatus Eremiobacteraeota bacterium]|nr:hypothetical protein [Candidatus Eremiobacteraeota bacterium]
MTASLAEVESAIFEREGFRVKLVPFHERASYEPYAYPVMGPNTWRLSEWKAERLGAYLTQIRSAIVYRGDGSIARSDVRIGTLRDSYFEAYRLQQQSRGPAVDATPRKAIDPSSEGAKPAGSNVVEMHPEGGRTRRTRRKK